MTLVLPTGGVSKVYPLLKPTVRGPAGAVTTDTATTSGGVYERVAVTVHVSPTVVLGPASAFD